MIVYLPSTLHHHHLIIPPYKRDGELGDANGVEPLGR